MRKVATVLGGVAAVAGVVALSTCSGDFGPTQGFAGLLVVPQTVTLLPGTDTAFQTYRTSNVDTVGVVSVWTASDSAAITAEGRYTAPQVTGEYRVIALFGDQVDTAVVTVSPAALLRMEVEPDTVVITGGTTFTFRAVAVDTDSQQVPVSALWSASGGAVNPFTGEWTAPSVLGSYQIYATTGVFTDTAVGRVDSVAGPPPPPQGAGEPAFQAGDVMAYREDFERLTSTDQLKQAYPARREVNGTINLDQAAAGEGQKSYRIDWAYNGCLGDGDADVLIERGLPDSLLYRDWYISYLARWEQGYQHAWPAGSGCSRGNASKEMVIFRNSANTGGRLTWGVTWQSACPDVFGTLGGVLWNFSINSEPGSEVPVCPGSSSYRQHLAMTSKNPASLSDGAWHRITLRIREESAVDAGDGILQVWIDGVQIMNYDGGNAESPAFGKVYARTMTVFRPIQYQTVVNAGAPQAQKRWFDDVKVWYRP